ncbi:DUF2889 domain-containing protein [Pelistega suis]|uniref:DUF2889 domain-containing protein n=1 Tax=Pelistega suis TaxID=1631957 RepID=UPI00211C11B7|nr:DUF2889 domain-containing protein [Pelistega suis]MCQ9328595.1 DUF2889 domain-containing protein [Pelistega suis]
MNNTPARTPIHTRRIEMQTFLREDDKWDLEATLLDVKAYAFTKKNGAVVNPGDAIHDMKICLTVTEDGLIEDAKASYIAAPYNEVCFSIQEAYRQLIGLHLLRGFRQKVKEKFAKTEGCTHMSELVALLPTVFVQSLAKRRNKRNADLGKRPFQLEGCHALRLDSPAVQEFYPEWYKAD